uniref:Endocuticle structural glycoprotein SgAbd-2 n=1 Tax=Glossina brevipalpis TaxID=37001 RepID=A0A1A9X159_9MUSC
MEKIQFRLISGIFLSLTIWVQLSHCQQSALFTQPAYQRQSAFQRQQLRQRQQIQQQPQQQIFSNTGLNPLNPLTSLNSLSPVTSSVISQNQFRNYNQVNPQNFIPITAYQNEINYDGSFSYGYAAGDGTTAQAQGYVKNLGLGEAVEAQVVQGSYSYTSPEGTPITVRYIADENGFRAEGAHIPTPPPIPDAIAKSLQYIASVQQPYQQELGPNLNPYQTPFRQYSTNIRGGGSQASLQFQQQQQRFLQQQQQNAGQYQGESQFGTQGSPINFGTSSTRFGSQFDNNLQGTGAFLPQQKNLTQQQHKQHLNKQQHEQQTAADHEQQQQQQLATQELRARPNQLINPYGFNPYRRYKKAIKNSNTKD